MTVNSVHFRFEDELVNGGNGFAFGVTLNKFEVFTTSEKWEKAFLDRTK